MPMIKDLQTFQQAVDGFPAETFVVEVDPEADALIRESLDGSGMVLIGAVHGAAENPLVISSNGRPLRGRDGRAGMAG